MVFINIHVSAIDSVEFQSADDSGQATWLKLMRFLCGQEDGDRVRGAANWTDRTWMRTCGVSRKDVNQACQLWRWDGLDLIVKFYPHEAEAAIKAKRKAGKDRWAQHGAQPGAKLGGEQKGNGNWKGEKERNVSVPVLPFSSAPADLAAMRDQNE